MAHGQYCIIDLSEIGERHDTGVSIPDLRSGLASPVLCKRYGQNQNIPPETRGHIKYDISSDNDPGLEMRIPHPGGGSSLCQVGNEEKITRYVVQFMNFCKDSRLTRRIL